MSRNDRLIGLLLALQSGRRTAAQLAERFEVSRRTILRDIDALSQVGVPVVALSGLGGGYEISPSFWLAPVQLTSDEATLLLLGLKSLGRADGSPFGASRASVEEKLRAILPRGVLADAERDLDAIDVPSPLHPDRLGHLGDLRAALSSGGCVRIGYRSVRRLADHEIKPIRLYVEEDRWFCEAIRLADGETRRYRVDRIQSLERLTDRLPPVLTLPTTEALHVAVTARLSYAAARSVEDHPDFVGDLQEDETGHWLRFTTPTSELDYFGRELFALGPGAVVLEPPELRARIVALARATLRAYEQPDGDGTVSPNAPYADLRTIDDHGRMGQ